MYYIVMYYIASEKKIETRSTESFSGELYHFYWFLFIHLWTMVCYDTPSTPSPQLNRKWAWSTKIASKWRFFVPGLYFFFNFFFSKSFASSCTTNHCPHCCHN